MNSATIVQKLWNYCNLLRDDGMSYSDYVEQLTYLLFVKMPDERSQPPWRQPSPIAKATTGLRCWPKTTTSCSTTTATRWKRKFQRRLTFAQHVSRS